jgi:hypothetical protein
VQYAVPDGEWVVAPYEDGPVHVTVERHVGAVGGTLAQTGDVWVAVNPPVERRSEWHLIYAEQERHARSPHLETLVEQTAWNNGPSSLPMSRIRTEPIRCSSIYWHNRST